MQFSLRKEGNCIKIIYIKTGEVVGEVDPNFLDLISQTIGVGITVK